MGIRIEKTKEREEGLTIDEGIQDREERAAREVNWSSSQIYGKENREFGSFRLVQNGACHETSILGQFTPAVLSRSDEAIIPQQDIEPTRNLAHLVGDLRNLF